MSTRRSTALSHLISDHNMDKNTGLLKKQSDPVQDQPTIEDYPTERSLIWSRNFDTFKQLLVRWIVCCHIAFFQFENLYFRRLLFFIYPGLEKLLPKAASTIHGWVIRAFETRKDELRKGLRSACSTISISFDLWTSPNAFGVLGVIAHFISKTGKRRDVVLGLREVVLNVIVWAPVWCVSRACFVSALPLSGGSCIYIACRPPTYSNKSLVNTAVRMWLLCFLRSSRTMGSVVILGISWLTMLSRMIRVLRQYFERSLRAGLYRRAGC